MEKNKKILLVEDHQINQEMLRQRLVRRGYEVVLAGNGSVACSLALSQQPDLILMDLSLPIMDGWEATRRLKADEKTSSIPIIALTAHAMMGDLEKAMDAGCDDYHTKPIELPMLLQKIEALLPEKPEILSEIKKQVSPVIVDSHYSISEQTPSRKVTSSQTLLIVDDIENNRDILSLRLERYGYNTLLAVNGEEGLKIVKEKAVDLVLLDIMMPGISGLETLRQFRQMYSQAQLPILMVTAKDDSQDMVQAFKLGANDYITKPIDFPVALARIQSHLNTVNAFVQESKVQNISAPKQTKELSTNLVESPQVFNLDAQEQQSTLFVSPSQENTNLFMPSKEIKLCYTPVDSRSWKTGTFVRLSAKQAEIRSNKKITLSPQSKIKIRLWYQNDPKITGDILATFLGILKKDNNTFIIEFISPFPLIKSIIDYVKE